MGQLFFNFFLIFIAFTIQLSCYEISNGAYAKRILLDAVKDMNQADLLDITIEQRHDISFIEISYRYSSELDIKKARELTVLVTERALTAINTNSYLRPFLRTYPFTIENIKFRVFLKDLEENSKITSVSLNKGSLHFDIDGQIFGHWDEVHTESYEEAFDIVMGNDGMFKSVCEDDATVCAR